MNALVIAPRVNLPWAESEAQHVHNLIGGNIVTGDVTIRSVLDASDGKRFDLLWFASHGDDQGIDLSNERLTPDVLAQLVRRTRAKLVFLNACSSEQVAQGIFSMVQVPVVCTIAKTNDTTAYFTGRVFAESVASGISFEESFESSRTKSFRMIPEPNGKNMGYLESQVYTNRDDIYQLRREIAANREALDKQNRTLDPLAVENQRNRTVLYGILFVMLVMLGLLIRNTVALNQTLELLSG